MRVEVIQYLRESPGYISGEAISRKLNISRSAVWKAIQELRREGYRIIAAPHKGYQLEFSPDKLLVNDIKNGLNTKLIGKEIYCFDVLATTMETAFQFGIDHAKEGAVICAETQTKGKGRLGRHWASPEGSGLYFSVILRPTLSSTEVSRLTLLSAVAVAEAIRKVTGLDAQIKWPNDILIKGKKVCGILTELNGDIERVRFVVVGIGINVNAALNRLPENATSLKAQTGSKVNRIELFREVLRSMDEWYAKLTRDGFDEMIERWKELSFTIGRKIKINDHHVTVEGQAVGLDEYGGLLIKKSDGSIVRKMSGDVLYV
jgi:BirA family biotin operon repressor/biotin-[acetyl-CoA-carboxylase] ligase